MQTKKTGTTDGQPNKLGGGGRFKQMVASGKSPALAAFIGRKFYGKKKMATMATKGKVAEDTTDGGKDDSKKNSDGTPKAPKGIAVGNPNLFKKKSAK